MKTNKGINQEKRRLLVGKIKKPSFFPQNWLFSVQHMKLHLEYLLPVTVALKSMVPVPKAHIDLPRITYDICNSACLQTWMYALLKDLFIFFF